MNRNSTLKTRTPLRAKKPWNPTRKPLATHTTLKATKPMRKVGKVGKANLEANKKLKGVLTATTCEIGALNWPEFTECKGPLFLQNVHKHKRSYYKGNADLLSDINEVVRGCTCCHNRIEHDRELTLKVFQALRGEVPIKSLQTIF